MGACGGTLRSGDESVLNVGTGGSGEEKTEGGEGERRPFNGSKRVGEGEESGASGTTGMVVGARVETTGGIVGELGEKVGNVWRIGFTVAVMG